MKKTYKTKKKQQKSGFGAGCVAFGTVFALYSVAFKPHSLGSFITAAALSALAGTVISIMAPGLDTSKNQKTPQSLQKMMGDTGNPEVDALLERGRELIRDIRKENDLIPDNVLSAKLDILEYQCSEIFRTVYEKPHKASQIRKFMEYYLPTTLKMVRGYRMLDERGIPGQEAQNAKERIVSSLGVVLQGCEKLKEKLYQDDVLDLATDIDVLQQMLKRDGLTESELDAAALQARAAARIDNAVNAAAAAKEQPKAQTAQQPQWHIDPRFRTDGQAQATKPDQQ